MVETLSALRDLPELLGRIEQADRAELYQALGLTVRYRRIGSTEEVKLTSTLRSVDLKRVGGSDARHSQPRPAGRGPGACRRTERSKLRLAAICLVTPITGIQEQPLCGA